MGRFINQFGFKGYYPDLPTETVPDGGLVYGSHDFKVIDGKLTTKAGYSKLQDDALLGIPILFHKYKKIDGTEILIAFTTTDIYRWDDTNKSFKMITELYNTGTVTITESTGGSGVYDKVTLTGGTWDTTWDDQNTCYIGFDTDDPDSITAWYEVDHFIDANNLILKDTLTSGKTDVSYVLRKTYNASLIRRWQAINFYDGSTESNILIAINGYDPPIKWSGNESDRCEDLSSDAPIGKYMYQLAGCLIIGDISTVQTGGAGTETPYTLIWSDVANATVWDGTGSSGYQELYETPGEIRFIAPFGDYLAIVKEDAVILMYPTGNSDIPFNFKYIIRGKGAKFSTYGIINQLIGFITTDDIVLFDGTPQLKSIADGKIRRTFFSGLDYNKWYMVHSVYAPRYAEWRIYVPKLDENYPSETWVYDTKTGEWYYDDIGFTGSGAYNYKTNITIGDLDSIYGTIGNINVPIGSLSSSRAYDDVVTGDENGYVYLEDPDIKTEDGQNIGCVAITKDFTGNDIDEIERTTDTYIHYIGTGDTDDSFTVSISTDKGAYYRTAQTIDGANDQDSHIQKLGWNAAGRTCRIMYQGRNFIILGQKIGYVKQTMF